jgi:alkaline phosphatase
VTDSAAAASAMATGQKVNNSSIAIDIYGEKLTSISTLAKNAGKKVGVITTDFLDGATPAAFSSHALDRNESETIAKGQAQSGIDLFMGKATSAYQTTYSQFFTQSGYDLLFTAPSEKQLASEKLTVLLNETRSSYN